VSDFQQVALGQHNIIYDAEIFPHIRPEYFSANYWQQQQKVIGSSTGRGTTYFIEHQGKEYVLRHYLRGGLIGKVLHDQYLFTGKYNSRSWQEFELLQHMQQQHLPVPAPIAACIQKKGFYYSAHIIIEKIPGARDLHQILTQAPLSEQCWQDIGRAIASLHQQQIYHHDLNIHNIMLDPQQKVWLIDFDRCHSRTGQNWKQGNLSRLLRSLHKEKQQTTNYHWLPKEWKFLQKGYQNLT